MSILPEKSRMSMCAEVDNVQSLWLWYNQVMDSLIKADIFFFITTIGVGFVTVLFIMVLLYALSILVQLKRILSLVERESSMWLENIKKIRELSEGFGGKVASIVATLVAKSMWGKSKKTVKRSSKLKEDNNQTQ